MVDIREHPYTPRVGDWAKGIAKDGTGFTVEGEVAQLWRRSSPLYVEFATTDALSVALDEFVWKLAERPAKPMADGLYFHPNPTGSGIHTPRLRRDGEWFRSSGDEWVPFDKTDCVFTNWIRYVPAGSGETR